MSSSAESDTPRLPFGRWWVCIMLLLATTLNYMDRMALNQTASRIKNAFNLDNKEYGSLESAFTIAFGLGTLIVGWLVDRISVRWVYPIMVLGWSLAGFFTGFASSFAMLLVCRVFLGFFEAGNWPCGIRTTRQVLPPAERSLGNALFQSGTAIGAVITPFIVLACILSVDPHDRERTAHAAVAGSAIAEHLYPTVPDAWQLPFRVIGAVGVVWLLLWVFTVPAKLLCSVEPPLTKSPEPFVRLFQDRRFWILVVVILGVNILWHTFRVWLPLFLQKERGYDERDMAMMTTMYYLAADIGSWLVGLTVLLLVRRGNGVFFSRMVTYVVCAILALACIAVPFLERGPLLSAALMLVGFAAMGMFATYFSLSQELSAAHQGKVTGTLGCINAIFMATVFPLQGLWKDVGGTYGHILGLAWILPLIAVVLVLKFWPRETKNA